jgi:hypothetical protein
MNKNIVLVCVAGCVAALGIATVALDTIPKSVEVYSCPLEAKLCPDGSAVERSAPSCEFPPCPRP